METPPIGAAQPARGLRWVFFGEDGILRSGWAVAVFFAVSGLTSGLIALALNLVGLSRKLQLDDPLSLLFMALRLASICAATWAGTAAVKARFSSAGLSHPHKGRQFALGLALGALLLTLAVAVPAAVGQLGLGGPLHPPARLLGEGVLQAALLVLVALTEELALRGFVLLQLARGLGKVPAVLITSTLFGVLHLTNPNADWTAAANIALVGVLFGLLVYRTGSLWLCFGLHTSWNYFEGFVFGQPVSGLTQSVSLLRRTSVGSPLWTGGAFGPEASAWVAVLLALACVLTALSFRRRA